MYNKKEYINFIQNNKDLTECQKKDYLFPRRGINFVSNKSNKQIITYIENSINNHNYLSLMRLKILFSHYIDLNTIEKLMNDIQKKKLNDSHIYEIIGKNKIVKNNIFQSVFEDIKLFFNNKQIKNYYGYGSTKEFEDILNIKSSTHNDYDLISIFDVTQYDIFNLMDNIKVKKNGYLIIFAINVVDDFDEMIENIKDGINGIHIKKTYYNCIEYDFIMGTYGFTKIITKQISSTLGSEYNRPYYSVYKF